jgi:uncharacterized membrane protein
MTQSDLIAPGKNRLASIDIMRGLVMLIMALDHVRDMVTYPLSTHHSAAVDFTGSAAALFLTRWITHFCAPTFILLAGLSAFLYGSTRRRSRQQIALFLVSRGLWLVFIELTVVNFAWAFNTRGIPILQVIWAIGCSMIALSGLVWLPRGAVGIIGIVMIVAHNGLDYVQPSFSDASPGWVLLHLSGPLIINGAPAATVIYPLIPWIGVMALGYAIGPYFASDNALRPKRLLQVGTLLILLFFFLRVTNLYGDTVAWGLHQNRIATLISFLKLTKYPPSLQFLLMTLGPVLISLGLLEWFPIPMGRALMTIGRVSFFYYVLHLYGIHTIAVLIGLWQGFTAAEMAVIFLHNPSNFGISLGGVYIVWFVTILVMYPACAWFAGIKTRHRHWWLQYL